MHGGMFDRLSHSRGTVMKNLSATAVGTVSLLFSGIASAQNGPMMNGGTGGVGWMGGYGGYWMPVLLVVVVGLVVWIVMQRRK
jgi:ABC-type methionine transport system permease subunit